MCARGGWGGGEEVMVVVVMEGKVERLYTKPSVLAVLFGLPRIRDFKTLNPLVFNGKYVVMVWCLGI